MPEEMMPNQAEMSDDDYFSDIDDSMLSEETVAEDTPTEETETVQETPEEEWGLDVTYNKENRRLTKEEAITYAQKGMNYDKVNENYRKLTDELDALARSNNQSREEYLANLHRVQTNFEINRELNTLKGQYPDADESILRELAETRINANRATQERDAQLQADQDKSLQNLEAKKQIADYRKMFPDRDINEISDEVFAKVDEGYTLLEAQLMVDRDASAKEIESLKAANDIASKNAQNRQKSLGNTTSVDGIAKDDFWDEFIKY